MPVATGTVAARALMSDTTPTLMSPMCMLPSRPRVTPPIAAHVLGEHAPRRDAADEEHGHVAVGGTEHVVGLGDQGAAHGYGLLPATHVDAAQHFTLAIQLALDAVFHFAHQEHVVETLVGQFGLRRAAAALWISAPVAWTVLMEITSCLGFNG